MTSRLVQFDGDHGTLDQIVFVVGNHFFDEFRDRGCVQTLHPYSNDGGPGSPGNGKDGVKISIESNYDGSLLQRQREDLLVGGLRHPALPDVRAFISALA